MADPCCTCIGREDVLLGKASAAKKKHGTEDVPEVLPRTDWHLPKV